MTLVGEERLSDSPFVEAVWHVHSESAGTFTSAAGSRWEMVITRYQGTTSITVRGPETKASQADYPADTEFFGIAFKHGTFMPELPPGSVMDRNDVTFPAAGTRTFWLQGAAWELPTYDNADVFVNRLGRQGLLAYDDVVDAVLNSRLPHTSIRTVRRRFLRATGLTHNYIRQIQRAQYAVNLLREGTPILDTVFQAGYFDQPHLTRSLRQFVGRTPAQLHGVYVPPSILDVPLPIIEGPLPAF